MLNEALQEKYAPHSICFGCGPSNSHGLHVKSHVRGDNIVADWAPKTFHEAFPGVLNGGIIGCLLDCHSNWAAAWYIMKKSNLDHPPCTVTAEYTIKLLRPTPTNCSLHLNAQLIEVIRDKAIIEATLTGEGKICATCRGAFVAVKPGHPAYHRW